MHGEKQVISRMTRLAGVGGSGVRKGGNGRGESFAEPGRGNTGAIGPRKNLAERGARIYGRGIGLRIERCDHDEREENPDCPANRFHGAVRAWSLW